MIIANFFRRYQLFTFFGMSFFGCQHLLFAQEKTLTLTENHKFLPKNGQSGDKFGGQVIDSFDGRSVSLSGDRAQIGAYGDGSNGTESGSIYIFEQYGSDKWNQIKKTNRSKCPT